MVVKLSDCLKKEVNRRLKLKRVIKDYLHSTVVEMLLPNVLRKVKIVLILRLGREPLLQQTQELEIENKNMKKGKSFNNSVIFDDGINN